MSDWQCCRSGRCCTSPVGMTEGEWARVRAEAPGVPVEAQHRFDGRVDVSRPGGGSCAFYADGCTVYAVRPGVCRAFGCFGGDGTVQGALKRVGESAGVRRVAFRMLDEGERWTTSCE